MMRELAQVLGLLTIGVISCNAEEQVRFDLQDANYWFRSVVVPEDAFTLPKLESVSKTLLSNAPRRDLVVLSIFTDIDDAASASAVGRDSYAQWRLYYDQQSKRPLRAAQMISVRGDSVLRVRLPDGSVVCRVLVGRDPLKFTIDDATVEILVVNPRAKTSLDNCDSARPLSALVYAKTDARLTTSLCERVSRRIAEILNSQRVFVHLKNDHWFLSFGGYPVIYPFITGEPPSEEAYYNSLAFTCMRLCEDTLRCTQVLGPELPPRKRGTDRQ